MIHQDWIVRLIEQLALLLLQVTRLKQSGHYTEALVAVENMLQQTAGLGLISIRFLKADDILNRLVRSDNDAEGRDRALLASRLLTEAGALYVAQDRMQEHCDVQLKALELALGARAADPTAGVPEFAPDIDHLVAALTPCRVPADTRLRLMSFHERRGAYAHAEDALFDALEAAPGDEAVVEEGIAYCERLLELDDFTLAEGNLPREEVEDTLTELEARLAMIETSQQ